MIGEILEKGFEFDKDEILYTDYKKIKPAKDLNELKELLAKIFKIQCFVKIVR